MFRYILVPAPGAETDEPVFRTALALAQGAAGHLAFLHVHPDPQKLLVAMSSGDFGGGAGIGEFIESLEQDIESRRDRARQAVTRFCERENVAFTDAPGDGKTSATFQVEAGDEAPILADYARAADLTVIGRKRDDEAVALDLLEAVLLGSGRPLIIAPAKAPARIGRTIAITWKNTTEAAHAVASATPLLRSAESVTVISVPEGAHSDTAAIERLCHCLRWQNPATSLRVVPSAGRDPGDVLLAAVAEIGADLLVMGGYSHSRMREVVFGGFTRRVLRDADLPVLMAH